jgi:DNA mismatch repair protein MutL
MPAINVLPTHLVNKIAAGEVIERPASVVKELVENAIDAGAKRIDVTLEDGGKKRISVSDDGCGMGLEDLRLAFVPHATSKLCDDDGLFQIRTMGFRGEALASIASISHAHIRSRSETGDDEAGYEIRAAGESLEDPRPCAARVGTTVTVRDLFFNTPARRKFLRTTNTELGHVTEQVTRLALGHPRVAFGLKHNGREVQNLPATESTAQRARDLFGPELAEELIPLIPRTGPVGVAGLIGLPGSARSSAKWQYVFLNGRYIRDRLISHALREAYRGLVEPGRYPVVLVFLEIDPAQVDVNVHPTKVEVRFRESQGVHGTLLAGLKETLNRARLSPSASLDKATDDASGPADPDETTDESDTAQQRESLRQALADFFKSAPPPPARLDFQQTPREASGREYSAEGQEARASSSPAPPSVPSPWGAKKPASIPAPEPQARPAPQPESPEVPTQPVSRNQPIEPLQKQPQAILQVHESYLICQSNDGVMIVDQHAMHERVLYNKFRKRLAEGSLAGQKLLLPETLELTEQEMSLLEEHEPLLGQLGIAVESFGPRSAAIQQFPAALLSRKVQPARFVRELLDTLSEDATADAERLLEDVLAMMACKAAIKARHPLTQEEMQDLLAEGLAAEKASACPHGRPTTLRLRLADLEKQFHRT